MRVYLKPYIDNVPIAKCVVLYKGKKNDNLFEIAFLDNNLNYDEYCFHMNSKKDSWYNILRIDKIFKKYRLVKDTHIIIVGHTNLAFTNKNAIIKYIEMLGRHIHFIRRYVISDRVLRRIRAKHKTFIASTTKDSQISDAHMLKIWRKLIKNECCPWISDEINEEIQQKSVIRYRMSMMCRMSMYYALVAMYLKKKTDRYNARAAAKKDMEEQEET